MNATVSPMSRTHFTKLYGPECKKGAFQRKIWVQLSIKRSLDAEWSKKMVLVGVRFFTVGVGSYR